MNLHICLSLSYGKIGGEKRTGSLQVGSTLKLLVIVKRAMTTKTIEGCDNNNENKVKRLSLIF